MSSVPDESTTLWHRFLTSIEWIFFMWIRWRSLVFALCCVQFAGAVAQTSQPDKAAAATILVVGDSLSAEYGLQRGSGWVALLEQRLQPENKAYQMKNSSISGDHSRTEERRVGKECVSKC